MKRVQRSTKLGLKGFKEIKEVERRELAMLIDTDGSINPTDHLRPHIKVGMSSELPILIWELYGGCLNKEYRKGKKIHYEWEVNAREQVRDFLLAIIDYLILKKPQARIGLKMVNLLEKKPPKYKEKLESLAEELSKLNNALSPDIDIEEFKAWSLGLSELNLKERKNHFLKKN